MKLFLFKWTSVNRFRISMFCKTHVNDIFCLWINNWTSGWPPFSYHSDSIAVLSVHAGGYYRAGETCGMLMRFEPPYFKNTFRGGLLPAWPFSHNLIFKCGLLVNWWLIKLFLWQTKVTKRRRYYTLREQKHIWHMHHCLGIQILL